jgi:hypothetical protein
LTLADADDSKKTIADDSKKTTPPCRHWTTQRARERLATPVVKSSQDIHDQSTEQANTNPTTTRSSERARARQPSNQQQLSTSHMPQHINQPQLATSQHTV